MRVHPSGRKVYIVKTRYRGRPVKVTIGPHGVATLADARTRAAEIMSDARAGKNPAGWNRPDAKVPTMRELSERFLDEYVPSHCKPSTAEEYRRSVELCINPRIGKLLGHTQVQTAARYAHLANDPVKSAANRIASRIAEVVG